MITKGLKKGEKFEDGGRYFVIEEVLTSGDYISRQITETERTARDEAPKKVKTETKKKTKAEAEAKTAQPEEEK